MTATPFTDAYEATHRSHFDGDQYRYKFDNGYGASVVRYFGSYGSESGLWELAVLGVDGRLTYDTPITDDVIGYLTPTMVTETLNAIAALEQS